MKVPLGQIKVMLYCNHNMLIKERSAPLSAVTLPRNLQCPPLLSRFTCDAFV